MRRVLLSVWLGLADSEYVSYFDLPLAQGPVAVRIYFFLSESFAVNGVLCFLKEASLDDPLDPKEFRDVYAKGWGKPLLLKGYSKHSPAFSKWTDEYLENTAKNLPMEVWFSDEEKYSNHSGRVFVPLGGKTLSMQKCLQRYAQRNDDGRHVYCKSKISATMSGAKKACE
jgi:hypothetical protein